MEWVVLVLLFLLSIVLLIAGWFRLRWPRDPDVKIGPLDKPNTLRWWVIPRNPLFNIYLHKFVQSDTDEALHDHPWLNMSILLRGEYLEIMGDVAGLRPIVGNLRGVIRRPFRPVFRRAVTAHRVLLFMHGEYNDIPYPVWSLFITGPVLREWGFHCPKGWVHWKDFTHERYQPGKGCN